MSGDALFWLTTFEVLGFLLFLMVFGYFIYAAVKAGSGEWSHVNKGLFTAAIVVVVVIVGLVILGTGISISNREVVLRNTILAKQQDNTNEYDNMWKKIAQVAQVTEKERQSLMDLFVGYADARTKGGSEDGSLANWIKEAVPSATPDLFVNLQNIITSSRDRWTMRQKELIDLKREHDNLRMTFPGSLFVGRRPEIKIQIVTSTRTGKAFETGQDDDVNVFSKP